jgi:hypothetical protein
MIGFVQTSGRAETDKYSVCAVSACLPVIGNREALDSFVLSCERFPIGQRIDHAARFLQDAPRAFKTFFRGLPDGSRRQRKYGWRSGSRG